MKLVSFVSAGAIAYGVHLGDTVLDLRLAASLAGEPALPPDMIGFIAIGAAGLTTARRLLAGKGVVESARIPADRVRLLAPIPRPTKNVFCVGRNYVDHVAEGYRARGTEIKLPEFPQFFTKPPTAVIGPDETFTHDPALTQMLDYEVELAIVIGTRGCDIAAEDALQHVYGYTIANDITARDLQRRHDQWFKGKGLDRSCPLGPWIVTADEIEDYRAIELSLYVNGERRQNAKVAQMIFDIPAIIASLSAGMTLEPGDIIATGTPSGVGYAMTPPHPLKAGDEVVCEIAPIGRLVTRIVVKGPVKGGPVKAVTLPAGWPGGKPLAVAVSVMLEGWTDDAAPGIGPMGNVLRAGVLDLQARSWAEYGARVGAWRILDILAQAGVRAVFYTSGVLAERYPALMRAIADAGHSVAGHSWSQHIIPATQTPEDEARDLARCVTILTETTGTAPLGWVSPRCTPSARTTALLAGSGFAWHADFFDNDLPRVEPTTAGPIVAMPFSMEVNDMPLSVRYGQEPEAFPRILEKVVAGWPRLGNRPGCVDITVHAHVYGRPAGALAFIDALDVVKRYEEWAWLTDHDALARMWRPV